MKPDLTKESDRTYPENKAPCDHALLPIPRFEIVLAIALASTVLIELLSPMNDYIWKSWLA